MKTMNKLSYLLALDGSVESKSAAQLAWCLAKKTGARLTTQHVINVRDIWQFLRPRSTGFIGSGPYVAAFQCMANGLREIGEALMLSYRSQAEAQGIEFSTHIDEGDLVAEIYKRAKDHDLLIIGHRVLESSGRSLDYSLCEELATSCPCPMLIVMGKNNDWTSIKARVLGTNVDLLFVDKLAEFAKSLQLSLTVELAPNIASKEAQSFIERLSALDHKQWNIYQTEQTKFSHQNNELLAIVPEEKAVQEKPVLCLNTKDWGQSTLLIWRKQTLAISS